MRAVDVLGLVAAARSTASISARHAVADVHHDRAAGGVQVAPPVGVGDPHALRRDRGGQRAVEHAREDVAHRPATADSTGGRLLRGCRRPAVHASRSPARGPEPAGSLRPSRARASPVVGSAERLGRGRPSGIDTIHLTIRVRPAGDRAPRGSGGAPRRSAAASRRDRRRHLRLPAHVRADVLERDARVQSSRASSRRSPRRSRTCPGR